MQNASFTASPANLNFTITLGGAAPPTQTVAIDALNAPSGGVQATVSTSAAWLSVTGTNGATTPTTFQVGINPASLPGVGTFTGQLGVASLTTPGVTGATVTVTLTVVSVSTVTATPASGLTFAQQAGGANPTSQAVSIASTGSPLSFTSAVVTNTGTGWLSVNPTQSIQSPATLFVNVNGAALSPGLYTGTITLTATGASNSPYVIPVTLTVTTNPILNISAPALSFAYQIGQSNPPAQTLTFASSGSAINYSLAAQTQNGNWLSVNPSNATTPGTATVQATPGSLLAGTYNGSITVTSVAGTQTIPVTLLVTASPVVQLDQNAVTINYQFGGGFPGPAMLQVLSSSTPIPFTVSSTSAGGPNFLSVTPTTGTTPAQLLLSVNQGVLAGLAPGTYTSSITITGQSSANGPIVVPVQLVVSTTVTLNTSQNSLVFNYQTGQAQPAIQTLDLTSTAQPFAYTISVATTNCSNANFLSATPSSGTTPGSLAVSIDPTGIISGSCMGQIIITAPGATNSPKVIPVDLNVSGLPFLKLDPAFIVASAQVGSAALIQQSIALSSTNPNAALPYSVTVSTAGSVGGWLQVSPAAGTTPSNLKVTINPANLPPGAYNGTIQISYKGGATATRLIYVQLTVSATGNATAAPAQLTFSQQPGGAAPAPQTVSVTSGTSGVAFFATATSLNHFLSVVPTSGATPGSVTVAVNGASLSQGTYTGYVTLLIPGAANSPVNVPVTLNVGNPVTLSVSSSTLSFDYAVGSAETPAAQNVQVSGSSGAVPFTVTVNSAGNFLTATPTSGNTPATISIGVDSTKLAGLSAGSYTGTVIVASPNVPGGSQTITATLTIATAIPPNAISVVNAASSQLGAVSPGELITIYGTNIGPPTPAYYTVTSGGTMSTTTGNTQVLFDSTGGKLAAPVIYAGPKQINAIVPYEENGRTTTSVQVVRGGVISNTLPLQVVPAAPAIFTVNQAGTGQGAILNQDGSANNTGNPAKKGSVIQIFATGEGETNPPGITGTFTPGAAPYPKPLKPVSVTINGIPAQIQFEGEAPTIVSGMIQVNAVVLQNAASGNDQVILTIGEAQSPAAVTVAVQ